MTKRLFGFALIIFAFASCKKESITLNPVSVKDYFPMQVGKYIIYDLDSTVFTSFNQIETIRHYQAKYEVEAETTDNIGRNGFTIYRYLRSDSTKDWAFDNVFTAFNTGKSLEYIQDNLRFIKLAEPIEEGFSWMGNSYLAFNPYRSYDFANPAFMEDWSYTYKDVNQPLNINGTDFENAITVFEVSDSTGDPNVPGTDYAEKTYSIEKYAKNVGLIYKDFIHWEFQSVDNTYKGFGEKLTIIDHN